MLAVQGYYDGENIKLLESVEAKPNQRVIVTVMDEFIDSEKSARKSLRGVLSSYANSSLINSEKDAWEHAMVEKYGNA